MTTSRKNELMRELAHVLTCHQSDSLVYVYIAHFLCNLSKKGDFEESLVHDIERIFEIFGEDCSIS